MQMKFTISCSFAAALTLGASLASAGSFGPLVQERTKRERPTHVRLPTVDVDRLLAEDESALGLELPLRVGLPIHVGLSPDTAGSWEQRNNGDRIWRLTLESEDARWLALSFDRLQLEPGSSLSVIDHNGRPAYGPVSSFAGRHDGPFWLPPIEGSSVTVELSWPARLRSREPDVRIGSVSHGYRRFWGLGEDRSSDPANAGGACNVDVSCPDGDEWQDEKRGVVELFIAGSRVCTGTLINTTSQDCRPYVLTAAHCLHTQADAEATLFRFAYERSLCENGEAPTHHMLQGSTLLATHDDSDASLLELDDFPPSEFEPYFNGWNRGDAAPEQSWTIHHPYGAPKKISYDADPATDGGARGWGASHWRVNDWEAGTTEPGSSGAPLFDPDGRVVGQLHGGTATCEQRTWDEFGKLSAAWVGDETPGTRLSDWLDPTGSGALAIDGLDGLTCARRFERTPGDTRDTDVSRRARDARRYSPTQR